MNTTRRFKIQSVKELDYKFPYLRRFEFREQKITKRETTLKSLYHRKKSLDYIKVKRIQIPVFTFTRHHQVRGEKNTMPIF